MKYLLMLIILLIGLNASPQQGPTVSCYNCDGMKYKPMPVNGNWYNRAQSGTGYLIEIQNGYLSGFYFGFNEDGSQKWLSFQGLLEPGSADSDVTWQLDTQFLSFKNGNAFNQSYQAPDGEETSTGIKLEFIGKHYARVSIDGGEVQNIQPQVYGVAAQPEFEESDLAFPDLDGLWTFVYKRNHPEFFLPEALFSNDFFAIERSTDLLDTSGTKTVIYDIENQDIRPPYERLGYGSIQCSNPINDSTGERELICLIHKFPYSSFGSMDYLDEVMVISPTDFGPFQFSAEFTTPGFEEQGFTIEAIRHTNQLSYKDN